MRYCMNFYLNWRRNYAWSKLEVCFLLSKYRSSTFDHAQFLCHLRQKCIQYLILKLQSIVKKGGKGQRMFAFLCSKIALCSWDFQYIKWALLQQNLQALYLSPSSTGSGSMNDQSWIDPQLGGLISCPSMYRYSPLYFCNQARRLGANFRGIYLSPSSTALGSMNDQSWKSKNWSPRGAKT